MNRLCGLIFCPFFIAQTGSYFDTFCFIFIKSSLLIDNKRFLFVFILQGDRGADGVIGQPGSEGGPVRKVGVNKIILLKCYFKGGGICVQQWC